MIILIKSGLIMSFFSFLSHFFFLHFSVYTPVTSLFSPSINLAVSMAPFFFIFL